MDRLSPLDATFLLLEDRTNHMHIGSVGIFEGPPPPHAAIEALVASKMPLVPRYRQRIRTVPLQLNWPVWVDDPHFNLGYHLRFSALPSPGGNTELRNLVGRVMSQQLDRTKPLWEMWIVEGLEDDRFALVSKVHHCMVDGISGSDLLAILLDQEPEPPLVPPPAYAPPSEPSELELARDAVMSIVAHPIRRLRSMFDAAGGVDGLVTSARARAWPGVDGGPRPTAVDVVAHRTDRTAPQLGLGPSHPAGREGDPRRARRDGQRRRARGDHQRVP